MFPKPMWFIIFSIFAIILVIQYKMGLFDKFLNKKETFLDMQYSLYDALRDEAEIDPKRKNYCKNQAGKACKTGFFLESGRCYGKALRDCYWATREKLDNLPMLDDKSVHY